MSLFWPKPTDLPRRDRPKGQRRPVIRRRGVWLPSGGRWADPSVARRAEAAPSCDNIGSAPPRPHHVRGHRLIPSAFRLVLLSNFSHLDPPSSWVATRLRYRFRVFGLGASWECADRPTMEPLIDGLFAIQAPGRPSKGKAGPGLANELLIEPDCVDIVISVGFFCQERAPRSTGPHISATEEMHRARDVCKDESTRGADRGESQRPRAESREPRAESREPRAEIGRSNGSQKGRK